jgi:hypothetical protein
MQHQLPTMIPAGFKYTARSWVKDHQHLGCSQDGFLATCLEVCQIFKLLADLPTYHERPNQTDNLLQLIEKEWMDWKLSWQTETRSFPTDRDSPSSETILTNSTVIIPLQPRQESLMRFCDLVVRFHIAERRWVGVGQLGPGASGFAAALLHCFNTAIEVVLWFAKDLASRGILPYAQDMVWIASSSAAIYIRRVSVSDFN